jgi:hypothetical protein
VCMGTWGGHFSIKTIHAIVLRFENADHVVSYGCCSTLWPMFVSYGCETMPFWRLYQYTHTFVRHRIGRCKLHFCEYTIVNRAPSVLVAGCSPVGTPGWQNQLVVMPPNTEWKGASSLRPFVQPDLYVNSKDPFLQPRRPSKLVPSRKCALHQKFTGSIRWIIRELVQASCSGWA